MNEQQWVLEQWVEGRWHVIRRGSQRHMLFRFHKLRKEHTDRGYRVRPVRRNEA